MIMISTSHLWELPILTNPHPIPLLCYLLHHPQHGLRGCSRVGLLSFQRLGITGSHQEGSLRGFRRHRQSRRLLGKEFQDLNFYLPTTLWGPTCGTARL